MAKHNKKQTKKIVCRRCGEGFDHFYEVGRHARKEHPKPKVGRPKKVNPKPDPVKRAKRKYKKRLVRGGRRDPDGHNNDAASAVLNTPLGKDVGDAMKEAMFTSMTKQAKVEKKMVKVMDKLAATETQSFSFDIKVPTGTSRAWMQAMVEIVRGNLELMARKNHDYGRSNISDFDWVGVVIRMNDKFKRISNAVKFIVQGKQLAVTDENIEDIFNDIMNYAVIGRMVRDGKWLL